jgi:autotransporter strand-loop-strand O-heptosyltransferase
MAHKEQRDFCIRVKEQYPNFFKNKKVLDIGSLDINGSNRDLFENCDYLGIDVGEGRNVDLISVGHLFQGPNEYFDTIISTEVFEHDMFYEKTIQNIMRMLKPGGLFLFTCAAPGRPEHGTRRSGEHCAPLLIQISEDWADYYKNLDDNDIKKIHGFTETFPDGYFELNNIFIEIPADLYFYGIKGGTKYYVEDKVDLKEKEKYKEHVFVIDSWPNNESKENDLINLIKKLKTFNIDIVLVGHYPIKPEIQKMVDHYIFDKKNDLLVYDEFETYGVASGRWTSYSNMSIINENEFHHDYAIWETMKNAFNYCKYLNKQYIHFLEYDNDIDIVQYRQSFIERIESKDVILYEYHENSTNDHHLNPFCATFIFSIRTNIALQVIEKYKNKWEYFTNKPKGWQLERTFLHELRLTTNRIEISKYIANNNELNTQAVWNRDNIDRNGAKFQIYLAGDKLTNNLYIHLISGFSVYKADKDYLVEVVYGDIKNFYILKKDEMLFDSIGQYKRGERVKVYYQGVEVFNEMLIKDFDTFYKMNYIEWKISKNPTEINHHFVDGAYVHLIDQNDDEYNVEYYDNRTEQLIYSVKLKNNWWAKTNKKYFVDWKIIIKNRNFEKIIYSDYTDKRVLITFESKSLGDTLAWIPYVEAFREKHNAKVVCSTFWNSLFKETYKEIEFIEPGNVVENIYAQYRIGLFKNDNKINYDYHPNNPLTQPLTKIASDILGLDYVELKPKLKIYNSKKRKIVTIAVHSTSQCKYWNNPNGWQDVVDYLKSKNYEVILLSKEEDGYMGNRNPIGVIQHPPGDIEKVIKVIQESELFIGLSSGLSWLSWACNVPTVLVSGFTDDDLEPKNGVHRVINKNVCHGCWSRHDFNPGDWNWCPEHKGTNRQFECSKQITSEMVIEQINKIIS